MKNNDGYESQLAIYISYACFMPFFICCHYNALCFYYLALYTSSLFFNSIAMFHRIVITAIRAIFFTFSFQQDINQLQLYISQYKAMYNCLSQWNKENRKEMKCIRKVCLIAENVNIHMPCNFGVVHVLLQQ